MDNKTRVGINIALARPAALNVRVLNNCQARLIIVYL